MTRSARQSDPMRSHVRQHLYPIVIAGMAILTALGLLMLAVQNWAVFEVTAWRELLIFGPTIFVLTVFHLLASPRKDTDAQILNPILHYWVRLTFTTSMGLLCLSVLPLFVPSTDAGIYGAETYAQLIFIPLFFAGLIGCAGATLTFAAYRRISLRDRIMGMMPISLLAVMIAGLIIAYALR